MRILLNWVRSLFTPKPSVKRLELRFCSYNEADALIKANPAWRVAQEEDKNRLIGWVYIERVE